MTDHTFEIGKFYWVPTVRGRLYTIEGDWPVIGPKHEDNKYIGFPYQHYHIDWRFVSVRLFNRVAHHPYSPLAALVLLEGPELPNPMLPLPVMKRRKCFRDSPAFPEAPWHSKLEVAFAENKIIDGICPHRRISLKGCARGDVVTCPGHGLRWNIKSGELVPRRERTE